MKTSILGLILLLGMSTEGMSAATTNTTFPNIETAITDDGFKPIDKDKLPQEIKATLSTDFSKHTIVAAAVSINRKEGTCIYQVTLMDEGNKESILLFNESGNVINQYQ